jgi:hypothetical protein
LLDESRELAAVAAIAIAINDHGQIPATEACSGGHFLPVIICK